MGRLVEEIMNRSFVNLSNTVSVFDAIEFLRERNLNQLPVTEEGNKNLIGLLSVWNITAFCLRESLKITPSTKIQVHDVMEKKVVHCYPKSHCNRVAELMVSTKLESLPVIKHGSKELVGVLNIKDIVNGLFMLDDFSVKPQDHLSKNQFPTFV